MAAWLVCALCAFVLLKPQEVVPALRALPVLYLLFAAAAVACVFDGAWRRIHAVVTPQLCAAIAFLSWALLTTAVKSPDGLEREAIEAAIVLGLLAVMSVALSSEAGLRLFATTYFACALLVSAIAIHQSSAPLGCMIGEPEDWEGRGEMEFDGRSCATDLDCYENAPVADGNYRCEHVGLFGTSTIEGRVRYRGSLADPNELSLMVASAAPLGVALFERLRRRPARDGSKVRSRLPLLLTNRLLDRVVAVLRGVPIWALVGVVATVVVLSKSRAGLLVFATFAFATFVRRAGAWGVVAACFCAPALLLVGSGKRGDAEASSDERMELLREALQFVRDTKGIGLGVGRFHDESSIGLTAHNAYLLAAAETGLVGMVLFGVFLYVTIKVPVVLWMGRRGRSMTEVERFAPALTISCAAVALGIFFLSWTYKDVLYMLAGASAALYGVARRHDPSLRISFRPAEIAYVALGMMGLLAGAYVLSRFWSVM